MHLPGLNGASQRDRGAFDLPSSAMLLRHRFKTKNTNKRKKTKMIIIDPTLGLIWPGWFVGSNKVWIPQLPRILFFAGSQDSELTEKGAMEFPDR